MSSRKSWNVARSFWRVKKCTSDGKDRNSNTAKDLGRREVVKERMGKSCARLLWLSEWKSGLDSPNLSTGVSAA